MILTRGEKSGNGSDYVQKACENVQRGQDEDNDPEAGVKSLKDEDAIREELGTGGTYGKAGYLNRRCGWADSERAVKWVLGRLQESGKVRFVRGTVEGLISHDDGEDHHREGQVGSSGEVKVMGQDKSKEEKGRNDRRSMFEIPFRGTRRSMFEFAFRSHRRQRRRRRRSRSRTPSASSFSSSSSTQSSPYTRSSNPTPPSAPSPKVLGAHISTPTPTTIYADLTILALGAWSPSLIDLRGRLQATGQILAYIPISSAEAARYSNMPVILDLKDGLAAFPPNGASTTSGLCREVRKGEEVGQQQHIKFLRHGYGYRNPTTILPPSSLSSTSPKLTNLYNPKRTTSLPSPPPYTPIPQEGLSAFHTFLSRVLPSLGPNPHVRLPRENTRICWYADTPTGDFLIDYHPGFPPSPFGSESLSSSSSSSSSPSSPACSTTTRDGNCDNGTIRGSLFIATGGSGHGFKFLPVLGEEVLKILEGRAYDPELKEKWRWREEGVKKNEGGQKEEGGGKEEDWYTEDGSRGGVKGMVLGMEMSKGGSKL